MTTETNKQEQCREEFEDRYRDEFYLTKNNYKVYCDERTQDLWSGYSEARKYGQIELAAKNAEIELIKTKYRNDLVKIGMEGLPEFNKLKETNKAKDAEIEKQKVEKACHVKVGVEYGKIINKLKAQNDELDLRYDHLWASCMDSYYWIKENQKLKAQLQIANEVMTNISRHVEYLSYSDRHPIQEVIRQALEKMGG